jgi:hypothetical protein
MGRNMSLLTELIFSLAMIYKRDAPMALAIGANALQLHPSKS